MPYQAGCARVQPGAGGEMSFKVRLRHKHIFFRIFVQFVHLGFSVFSSKVSWNTEMYQFVNGYKMAASVCASGIIGTTEWS